MVPISTFFNIIQSINLTKKKLENSMFLAAVPTTMNINFKLKELKRYGWLIDCYESIFKEKVVLRMLLTYNG